MKIRVTHLGTAILLSSTLLCGIFLLLSSQAGEAAVEIIEFSGEYISDDSDESGSIELTWITGPPLDTAAFYIHRGLEGGGELITISVEFDDEMVDFIPVGSSTTGDEYTVSDLSVAQGVTYVYELYELELSNTLISRGDITIRAVPESSTVGIDNRPTAESSATQSPTPTPTATSGTGTGTVTPTATDQFQATSTPQTTESGTTTATPASTEAATVTATIPPENTVEPTPSPAFDNDNNDGAPAVGEPDPLPEAEEVEAGESETFGSSGGIDIVPVAEGAEAEQYPDPDDVTDSEVPADADGAASGTETEGYVPPPTVTIEVPSDTQSIGENPLFLESALEEESIEAADEAALQAATSFSNRTILWIGFLGSLCIFFAGVVGAIYIFRQKQGP